MSGNQLTAPQLALVIVTAGLAIATVTLAVAAPAQASSSAISTEKAVSIRADAAAEVDWVEPVTAPAEEAPMSDEHEGDVGGIGVTRSGMPGAVRAGPPAISRDKPPGVRPADEPFTGVQTFRPAGRAVAPSSAMPLPVRGTWLVTCGYRCGRHDDQHRSTFALDIVRQDGTTAGQPVSSPVDGRVVAVVDSSVAHCGGETILGREAGSVIIIDFESSDGSAHRLRLVHLEPATIPDAIRTGTAVPVRAGSYLGSLATARGCAHLHLSLTRLAGSREIPEPMLIDGVPLKDCGGLNCWGGALIPPHR